MAIGTVPFLGASGSSGIGTEILLRLDVNHSATGGCGTGIFTMADSFGAAYVFAVSPFHFWAYKFHSRKTAAQMGFTPLLFH